MKSNAELAKSVLPQTAAALEKLEKFENAEIYASLCELAQSQGLKNGSVLWCVRIALTGRENTPGGASEMAELLGKERCLSRLASAAKALSA